MITLTLTKEELRVLIEAVSLELAYRTDNVTPEDGDTTTKTLSQVGSRLIMLLHQIVVDREETEASPIVTINLT